MRTAQGPAIFTRLLRLFLLLYRFQLFFQQLDFFIVFADILNLPDKIFQPGLYDVFSDLFFVKRDQLLDGADALFQVLAERENFLDDDWRARKRFQNAELSAFNA